MTNSRYFLAAFFLLLLILIAFVCSSLLSDLPKSPEELLEPLTVAQSECVEKITSKDTLEYVEVQEDNNLITVGYNTGDELHAVLVIVDDSNNCTVEFHKIVSERHYVNYADRWVISSFMRFGARDLTGDQMPEVYIGLASNIGRYQGDYFFYSKQADGMYAEIDRIYSICAHFHSFQISQIENEDRSRILVTNDRRCNDFSRSYAKYIDNYVYILTDSGLKEEKHWVGYTEGEVIEK